jgi:aspartate-semialdehyde dehydrogenase
MKKIKLAIVGATGLVGENILALLSESKLEIESVYLLASASSVGEMLEFRRRSYEVEDLAQFDFSQADYAIFSAGKAIAEKYVPRAAKQGCVVIDNSSQFRYDADVPLIIPEINGALLKEQSFKIIANPNCSTIQMLMALKPIYDAVGIKAIQVATYQSVSGHGREGLAELATQTANLLNARGSEPGVFPKQIAFNVIPQIDTFEDNGHTREEMKMVWETQKIFEDDKLKVNATAVRVPVFYGHALAIHLETKKKITAEQARTCLDAFPGVEVLDQRVNGGYPTPVSDASGKNPVFVGRIRENLACRYGINLWVVADNLRKGAALNAIQILELMAQ